MNISTGGPHVLLFERDQQLVALLTSELQLAGYECHAARTAVEVFDAIARYPVRLVLVNLAQAAATRREFWVALDTQRRGRGVQVLTFHCTNLAGYGPSIDDTEERSHNKLADIEVDGMLGIMNMVNTVRSRIAVSNTRFVANASSTPSIGTQATAPLPSVATNNVGRPSVGIAFAGMPSSPPEATQTSIPNPTDKIRAVIYPNQHSWSTPTVRENAAPLPVYLPVGQGGQIGSRSDFTYSPDKTADADYSLSPDSPAPTSIATNSSAPTDAFVGAPEKRSMDDAALQKESGLAQLSRMLEEQRSTTLKESAQTLATEQEQQFPEDTSPQPRTRSGEPTSISAMPLRASPIQDMPTDRTAGWQGDSLSQTSSKRPEEAAQPRYTYSQPSPQLMSIAATPASPIRTSFSPSPPSPQSEDIENRNVVQAPEATQPGEPSFTYPPDRVDASPYAQGDTYAQTAQEEGEEGDNSDAEASLVKQTQPSVLVDSSEAESTEKTADNPLLLDIVQSLPPMSSPPPQPQVHNGRATRSLGRVLLEGHLVPQNRLEVAQGIQRMLRGVDMNYQLGEILLMFKLLTPDQLLAASLVSYGLITTAQISALGRIRQELHSIGLEYDLENLLILFRILTSEQLREVRASWSS